MVDIAPEEEQEASNTLEYNYVQDIEYNHEEYEDQDQDLDVPSGVEGPSFIAVLPGQQPAESSQFFPSN